MAKNKKEYGKEYGAEIHDIASRLKRQSKLYKTGRARFKKLTQMRYCMQNENDRFDRDIKRLFDIAERLEKL